jgi:hypothetical protein
VLGLGYAAARDIGAFLRNTRTDDGGHPNSVRTDDPAAGQVAIIEGSSQSGRFIRSFLQLGFNQAEGGGRVFDGAFAHIAAGLLPLNVRFGQPHRNGGDQSDRDYPGYSFPFSYLRQFDPLTGTTAGLLDRCRASDTCPRIFHVATSLEFWELRQSLGLTDPLGRVDLPDPPEVRTYVLASTQHIPAAAGAPPGHCQRPAGVAGAQPVGAGGWERNETAVQVAQAALEPAGPVEVPAGVGADRHLQEHAADAADVVAVGIDPATLSGVIDTVPPEVLPGDYGVRAPQVVLSYGPRYVQRGRRGQDRRRGGRGNAVLVARGDGRETHLIAGHQRAVGDPRHLRRRRRGAVAPIAASPAAGHGA